MNSIDRRHLRGFSIVELMVAVTLGAILLGGAVTLFVNNRHTYTVTTDLSRLQENARFALDMISRDVRMAGHVGCATNQDQITDSVSAGAGELWDPRFSIEGVDNATAPETWVPSNRGVAGVEAPGASTTGGGNGVIIAGTDAITLRYFRGWLSDNFNPAGNPGADTIPDMRVTASTVNSLTVNFFDAATLATLGLTANLPAAVSDCGRNDVFLVTGIAGNQITTNATSLSYQSTANPVVAPYYAVRYFVGNNADGETALYRTIIASVGGALTEISQELFEGVENIQILYGVDSLNAGGQPIPDGIPDRYVRAGTAPGDGSGADLTNGANHTWGRVVSVRIALLLRTPQFGQTGEAAADTQAYVLLTTTAGADAPPAAFQGAQVGPFNDRRRRRVFNATALARNMQPTS